MGQFNISFSFKDFVNYYIMEIFPTGVATRKLNIRARDRVFVDEGFEEFTGTQFDAPISSFWLDTFVTDEWPYDVLDLNLEEWYDVILYDIYEKVNILFFQVISFEEYFLFFTIYLVFVMIINSVISEITWFTHLFNKRNNFQFFKQPHKQIFSFLFKHVENMLETKYYSYLYLHFFY